MKRICVVVLALALLLVSQIGAFATSTPEVMLAGVEGNTSNLVNITKPENLKDSTFNISYIVSGYGKGGTVVTLYRYNLSDQVYEKMYLEASYVDENGKTQTIETASEVAIGTSGLFMSSVPLGQGENSFLLRAENGDLVQYVEFEITKYSYNIIDLIKSLSA